MAKQTKHQTKPPVPEPAKHKIEPSTHKPTTHNHGTIDSEAQAKLSEEQQKAVVKGDDRGLDVFQQAREARGEDKGGAAAEDPKKEVVDTRAAEANYTDEQKKADLAKEARVKHLATLGIGPNDVGESSGGKKVEIAKVSEKMYSGPLTCESVSAFTHERISAKMELGSKGQGVGEEYVWHAFLQHHPQAMRKYFKIDETNRIDPQLRTRFE